MQVSSIAILINPLAGKGKSIRLSAWLEKQLIQKQIPCQVFSGEWPLQFDGFSDIWIIGGDGTINYFINRYPDCILPLALFKGGTGDDFGWKLYGNQPDNQQLETVLASQPRYIDAGKCNGRLFINCVGVGFDGEVLQSMSTIRYIGGHFGYLLAVIKKIFFFHEYTFRISTQDEHWNEPLLLVMITNSSRAGGGFMIAPEAEVNDGKLDMLLCKKLSVWKRLKYLPVIEKGKHMQLPFIIHRSGKSFSIECQKEMAVQVDGELLFARDLQVDVLHRKFLFRY